jgi:hypothetical protein
MPHLLFADNYTSDTLGVLLFLALLAAAAIWQDYNNRH